MAVWTGTKNPTFSGWQAALGQEMPALGEGGALNGDLWVCPGLICLWLTPALHRTPALELLWLSLRTQHPKSSASRVCVPGAHMEPWVEGVGTRHLQPLKHNKRTNSRGLKVNYSRDVLVASLDITTPETKLKK